MKRRRAHGMAILAAFATLLTQRAHAPPFTTERG
jgi:hypothetical protein